MCVVSAVGNGYSERWPAQYPWVQPRPQIDPFTLPPRDPKPPTRKEFEDLKKAVEEALEVLKIAKKYDDEHNEPECETDEKVRIIKEFAKVVGVDLSEVFGKDSK